MSYAHPPARIIGSQEQRRSLVGASMSRYIGVGSQTDGDFGLFESELAPGARGPGLHYHEHFSESFYVLEGSIDVLTDVDTLSVCAGELAYVPRLGIHGFRNASDVLSARFFVLFTPGAPREEYFDGLAALFEHGRQPTNEEIDAHAKRYDQINIRD